MTWPVSTATDSSVYALAETGRSILEVSLSEIVFWTLVIILSAIAAYVVYRAMERPRLRLTETDRGLRATRRDVIAYAVTIPFLIFGWWLFFWLILLIADTNLDVITLTTIPAAIVLAARVLAHASQPIAHEIAKAVPLTIITLIIITGSLRDEDDLFTLLEDAERVDITWAPWFLCFSPTM